MTLEASSVISVICFTPSSANRWHIFTTLNRPLHCKLVAQNVSVHGHIYKNKKCRIITFYVYHVIAPC